MELIDTILRWAAANPTLTCAYVIVALFIVVLVLKIVFSLGRDD